LIDWLGVCPPVATPLLSSQNVLLCIDTADRITDYITLSQTLSCVFA